VHCLLWRWSVMYWSVMNRSVMNVVWSVMNVVCY